MSVDIAAGTAWIAGANAKGRPFLAYVEDHGQPGSNDVFKLWINGDSKTGNGRIVAGDLLVRRL
jgi:hypothetical protein